MKVFITLQLLLLLLSLMRTCSGQQPVLVECSHFYFLAVAKRALFSEYEILNPEELFLGTGCPPTRVQLEELHFHYPVHFCGILKQVFFDGVVIHSWLIYVPRFRSLVAQVHLECVIPNPYTVSNKIEVNMPAQHWFLVQNRMCTTCGFPHFRDNWSTPYKPSNSSFQMPSNLSLNHCIL